MTGIARYSLVAFDCRDPQALAAFYSAITGWPIDADDGDWVTLRSDGGATLAFQLAPDHVPPQWPDPAHPQQAHIDFEVDDLEGAEQQVIALGARIAEAQPGTGSALANRPWTVFIDPAGHPFCLVRAD